MSITFVLLLIVAVMLWTPMVAISTSLHSSDAAGNAIASAYTAFAAIGLWIALAAAMLIAGSRGAIPQWAAICAFILVPASGATALKSIDMLSSRDNAGKVLMATPVLAPLLIAAYALWAFFPQFRAAVPVVTMGGVVWGALLILSIGPWPLSLHNSRLKAEANAVASIEYDKAEAERKAAEQVEWTAKFEKLNPDAPLWELMEYTNHGEELRQKAFERARGLSHRQEDVQQMLEWGTAWPIIELPNLGVEATPALCEKARSMFSKNAAGISPPVPGRPYDWEMQLIDPYLPAMEWLLKNGCDCMAEVTATESAVRAYPRAADRDQTLVTLARLRQMRPATK